MWRNFEPARTQTYLLQIFYGQDIFDIICNTLCPRIPILSDFSQALIGECLGYSCTIWKMQYIIHSDIESPRNYVIDYILILDV